MQGSYMERPGGVGRGKRPLDHASSSSDHEAHQPDRKRPALASAIVEALKVDSLQKLCSSLEPVLRRIVSEELECALVKLGPSKLTLRSSPNRIEGRDGRNLQLRFKSKFSLPLFTGGKVEGEHGAAIHIVLMDASTGRPVVSGPESSAKLDVVVLEGDFNKEDDERWTEEEFDSHIVKERDGKRPLLTGDLQVALKEGVGTLGELVFTDNSSWIRSRKFRLGLKVASGCCKGIHIREARTDAFTVKDHRGELYKKHYPPAPNDEVWRLEKIGKDGSFHKRLSRAGIYSVEDFLRLEVRDSQKLRNILGTGMSNKMWDVLLEHGKTCVLSGKHYVYYPEEMKDVSLVFNSICEFKGLISNGQCYSVDSLPDDQKLTVDGLVKKAYDNWMSVVEYDGQSILDFKQNQSVVDVGNSFPMAQQETSDSYEHQIALPSFWVPNPVEQQATAATPFLTEYNSQSMSFPTHLQNGNFCTQMPFGNLQQLPFPRSDNLLSICQPRQPTSCLQNIDTSNLASFGGADGFFPEEEIRMRSNEMLENEDMQHLLRVINMGGAGHASYNAPHDGYQYSSNHIPSSYTNYGFGDEQSRSSGKAVVGWLKLKAALRWGIFVRKKAAERRAQLTELDDL